VLKVVSLLKRKEGMSLEEFRAWALDDTPHSARRYPGCDTIAWSVVLEDNPALLADAVSEMWFDSNEARLAGFGTTARPRQPTPSPIAARGPTC
jgi:hypothetical protein